MLQKLENKFFKTIVPVVALGLLAFYIGFAVWTIFFTETANGDNVEHIHSTWLIAYGNVPYRDFFQHHNPLVWYIFAPFVRFFGAYLGTHQLVLLNIAHAVGICAGVITFGVAYRMSAKFFASRLSSLLSLLVVCPPFFYVYCFNYNPDTFMALGLAFGVYFLFKYFENSQLSSLIGSFFFFFLAFMFTQKVLIVLGQLGLMSLYVFYKKKTPISDILYALVLPLGGVLLFLSYLYNQGALNLYWLSNYPFNVKMQSFYGNHKIEVFDYQMLIVSVVLAAISILFNFKSGSLSYKILSFLFITELLQRCFYFAISPYYMLPLMIFMVPLNSVLIDKIRQKCFILIYVLLGVSAFYAYISPSKYSSTRGTDRSFARYIVANITPCDTILNSFLGNQSIACKNVDYYWAMLGHIDLVGESLNIAPKPDVNQLVLKYKPKIISGGVYWNNYYKTRGKYVFEQQVSPELIDKYYLPTPFADMYILKYEYRHKYCRYDANRGTWRYEK